MARPSDKALMLLGGLVWAYEEERDRPPDLREWLDRFVAFTPGSSTVRTVTLRPVEYAMMHGSEFDRLTVSAMVLHDLRPAEAFGVSATRQPFVLDDGPAEVDVLRLWYAQRGYSGALTADIPCIEGQPFGNDEGIPIQWLRTLDAEDLHARVVFEAVNHPMQVLPPDDVITGLGLYVQQVEMDEML